MARDKEELVFSSQGGRQKTSSERKTASVLPSKGPCKMRLEKNGRGGKQVTVLFNLPLTVEESKDLMKKLQQYLACGASYKNGELQFGGDMREKIELYFKKEKMALVRAGG